MALAVRASRQHPTGSWPCIPHHSPLLRTGGTSLTNASQQPQQMQNPPAIRRAYLAASALENAATASALGVISPLCMVRIPGSCFPALSLPQIHPLWLFSSHRRRSLVLILSQISTIVSISLKMIRHIAGWICNLATSFI